MKKGYILLLLLALLLSACVPNQISTGSTTDTTFAEPTVVQTCDHSQWEESIVQLEDYGYCVGTLLMEQCVDCGQSRYWEFMGQSCEFDVYAMGEKRTDGDGNTYYVSDSACPICGFRICVEWGTAWASVCERQMYETGYIYLNPEAPIEYDFSTTYRNHEYRESFTLTGQTCLEGWISTFTCAICGDSYDESGSDHRYGWLELDMTAYGFCGGTVEKYGCQVCGEAEDAWFSNLTCPFALAEVNDQGYEVYLCPDCGGSYWLYNAEITDDGRYEFHWSKILFSPAGEEIFREEIRDVIDGGE